MVLTRAKITDAVYKEVGLSYSQSESLVDDVINNIISFIVDNEKLTVSNFGSFYVLNKKSRKGRNPKTMEEKIISSRKVVSFYASENLINKINA